MEAMTAKPFSADPHHPLVWHRKNQLLSQRDLNQKANTSMVALIEKGRHTPMLMTMQRICQALDVDWRSVTEFREAMAQNGVEV